MTGGFWGSRKHLWTKNLINYTEENNFCTLVCKNFTKDNISMYIHKQMTLMVSHRLAWILIIKSLPANLSTFTFSSFLKHWSAFAASHEDTPMLTIMCVQSGSVSSSCIISELFYKGRKEKSKPTLIPRNSS